MANKRQSGTLRFVRTFFTNPIGVGAILPSSRELALAMTRDLALKDGETLLELGPGTGALTSQILPLLPHPGSYLGIEREPRFVEILQQEFPDLSFVLGSAQEARAICHRLSFQPPRIIISGLPFTNQRASEQDRILENIHGLLPDGGKFRTIQYVHGYALPSAVRFRRKTRSLIGRQHCSQPLLSNVPPAYVLTWTR